MRGGFVIAKPAGGLGSGAFSVNLITVRPELAFETLTESMLFPACAKACPVPRATIAAQSTATTAHARPRRRRDSVEGKGLIVFAPVFDPSRPRAVECSIARSSLRCRPGRAP